jgi:hypothetical protein
MAPVEFAENTATARATQAMFVEGVVMNVDALMQEFPPPAPRPTRSAKPETNLRTILYTLAIIGILLGSYIAYDAIVA